MKLFSIKVGEKSTVSVRMECDDGGCKKYHLHLPRVLLPLEMKAESVPQLA